MKLALPLLALALSLAGPAQAGVVIASRAQLNYLLADGAITDDFETLEVADSSMIECGVSLLDETTVVAGQGPGLVSPGAAYFSLRAPITWMGNYYQGFPMTRTLIAWNPSPPSITMAPQLFFGFQIAYSPPAPQLVGVDMLALAQLDYLTVEIYGPADELVQEIVIDTQQVGVGRAYFFGYRHDEGIGKLVIKNTKFGTVLGPNIDNHTYGPLDTTPVRSSSWGRLKDLYRR
jgi:hypothetical protein